MTVTVFVRFEPKSGDEPRVEEILRGMIPKTRSEPGCLVYDLFEGADPSGARRFYLLEKYRDADAVQAHRETGHYKDYRANVLDLLEQPPVVTILTALDVIGI